jgi:molecular chaperone GrpE
VTENAESPDNPENTTPGMPRGPQATAAPEGAGFPGTTGDEPQGSTVGQPAGAQQEPGVPATGEAERPEEGPAGAVDADLAIAQSAVAALTDDLKRLQAEYVNYKRRVDRDRDLVRQNAVVSVLSALLPVLDDLDRAREHGELEGGFKAVADSLERIVAAQGLVKFGRRGDEFDPRFHEALMHSHSPDVTSTTCQDIVTAGYQIGERVVRPARVSVVDPEPAAE